jgi:hypothetical protein
MTAISQLRLAQNFLITSVEKVQSLRDNSASPTPPGWDSAILALSNALAIVASTLHAQVQDNPAPSPGRDALRSQAAQCRRLAAKMEEQSATRLLQLALDYEAEADALDPVAARNLRSI